MKLFERKERRKKQVRQRHIEAEKQRRKRGKKIRKKTRPCIQTSQRVVQKDSLLYQMVSRGHSKISEGSAEAGVYTYIFRIYIL